MSSCAITLRCLASIIHETQLFGTVTFHGGLKILLPALDRIVGSVIAQL